MAKRPACPSCGKRGSHPHRLAGRTVHLCDDCEPFGAYVLAALRDDEHAEAAYGPGSTHHPITADDHDPAAWATPGDEQARRAA